MVTMSDVYAVWMFVCFHFLFDLFVNVAEFYNLSEYETINSNKDAYSVVEFFESLYFHLFYMIAKTNFKFNSRTSNIN